MPQALFKQQMEVLFLCKDKLAEERAAKEGLEVCALLLLSLPLVEPAG